MVARGFCRFSRFDLKSIPAKRRAQALQLQLKQWAPFANPEFAIVFEEHAALVWCWDATWLQIQRDQLPKLWQRADVIPETVLFAPAIDGMRLIHCLDGIEAQYWKAGELLASRWWSTAPDLQEYLTFSREVGHAVSNNTQLPATQHGVACQQPWLPVMTSANFMSSNPAIEQWIYVILFVGIALSYGWNFLRDQQFVHGIEQTKTAMANLTGKANNLIQARDNALKAVDEIASRERLNQYPTQIEMMSYVADAIPSDATITEWEFSENKLRMIIRGGLEVPSRADITKKLIDSGAFSEVQNLLTHDATSLSFRVVVLPKKGIVPLPDKSITNEKEKNG